MIFFFWMHKRILKIWIDPPHGNEKSDKNEVYVYIYTHNQYHRGKFEKEARFHPLLFH